MRVYVRSVLAILIVSLLVLGVYRATKHPIFDLNEINIEPLNVHSADLLFQRIHSDLAIRLLAFRGKSIWDIDLENILNVAERDLRIKEIKISRRLPNSLQLLIEPHTPVALILNKKNNKFFPVARNGEMLPPLSLEEAQDAPILRGDIFLNDQDLRETALTILRLLPEQGFLGLKGISELDYDKRLGFHFRTSPDGVQVLLGHDDFAVRLKHAQRVAEYLHTEQLQSRVIDARFGKKVVVKLRNEP